MVHKVEIADAVAADVAEMRVRIVRALDYLEESKPGKRYTALVAIWRAITGGEPLYGYSETEARRHYRALPSMLRARVHRTLGHAGMLEPSKQGSEQFFQIQARLEGMERGGKVRR